MTPRDDDAAKKRDEVLKRLLKTPPKPKKKGAEGKDSDFESRCSAKDDPKAKLD